MLSRHIKLGSSFNQPAKCSNVKRHTYHDIPVGVEGTDVKKEHLVTVFASGIVKLSFVAQIAHLRTESKRYHQCSQWWNNETKSSALKLDRHNISWMRIKTLCASDKIGSALWITSMLGLRFTSSTAWNAMLFRIWLIKHYRTSYLSIIRISFNEIRYTP